jgi:hypothetical protein
VLLSEISQAPVLQHRRGLPSAAEISCGASRTKAELLLVVQTVSLLFHIAQATPGCRLRELLKNDVVLYEAGRRLFARQLAAMSKRLKKVAWFSR